MQPHNTWEILARELSFQNKLLLTALLCAALLSGFIFPIFGPPWIPFLLILTAAGLLFRCPKHLFTPGLDAICEYYNSFFIPETNENKLCRPNRQPLAPFNRNDAGRPDVLFIVCESMSRRILESEEGRRATPFYQEFLRANAGRIHAFPMTVANSSTSDISYVSIFSGLSPDASHKNFHRQPLIWSAARARGYQTSFYSSGNFCWLNMDAFLFDDYLDAAITIDSLGAPCVNEMSMDDRALNRKILDDWEGSAFPRFCVVNYNMFHVPCLVPEESPATKKLPPYQRYLLALGIFDQCFRELIQRLEKEGRLDRTVIAFTGDHGETPRTGDYIDPEQNPDRIYKFHPDNLRRPLLDSFTPPRSSACLCTMAFPKS